MNLIAENLIYKPDQQFHLNDVSFKFKKGHLYTILGRTLSGKTTLLNLSLCNLNLITKYSFLYSQPRIISSVVPAFFKASSASPVRPSSVVTVTPICPSVIFSL